MTENNQNLLECRNLVKDYSGKVALGGINLMVPSGRIVGLLGPNGSGKTTLIKLASGLLIPTSGEILINGLKPGTESKSIVSYLPERTYFDNNMKVNSLISFFSSFYEDFDQEKAKEMLQRLAISPTDKLKSLSKGNKEKVQLILVMSRKAKLYLLDEPIGGVDPAARDYILSTIIQNYNPGASVIISTHLIADVEKTIDDVVLIRNGQIVLVSSVDDIREKEKKSVDELFREVFKC